MNNDRVPVYKEYDMANQFEQTSDECRHFGKRWCENCDEPGMASLVDLMFYKDYYNKRLAYSVNQYCCRKCKKLNI